MTRAASAWPAAIAAVADAPVRVAAMNPALKLSPAAVVSVTRSARGTRNASPLPSSATGPAAPRFSAPVPTPRARKRATVASDPITPVNASSSSSEGNAMSVTDQKRPISVRAVSASGHSRGR